jgi:hypothetical protein
MRRFQIKVVQKNKTHILCSVALFRKSVMSKNVVQSEGPQIIWRRLVWWISKAARTHTHTHKYVILIVFPLSLFSWTHLSVTLYAHCLSCFDIALSGFCTYKMNFIPAVNSKFWYTVVFTLWRRNISSQKDPGKEQRLVKTASIDKYSVARVTNRECLSRVSRLEPPAGCPLNETVCKLLRQNTAKRRQWDADIGGKWQGHNRYMYYYLFNDVPYMERYVVVLRRFDTGCWVAGDCAVVQQWLYLLVSGTLARGWASDVKRQCCESGR